MSESGKRKRVQYNDDESYENEPVMKKKRGNQGPTVIEIKENDGNVDVSEFRVSEKSMRALKGEGITSLFPIQVNTFNLVYEGKDVIGRARTGTGKTLSFSLPVIEKLIADKHSARIPAVLCLAPTRELAKQVEKVMDNLSVGRLSTMCIYGGTSYYKQETQLRRGVDLVVGTPGRIKDLLWKETLDLSGIKYFILDEADDMLNMGFRKDIEEIFSYIDTKTVQTLLYSATMPDWVKKIAEQYLSDDYVIIDLVGNGADKKVAKGIEHYNVKMPYDNYGKRIKVLEECVKQYAEDGRFIVFCDTQKNCQKLRHHSLIRKYTGEMLHGGMVQHERERTLKNFRNGHFRVLVATNVAARGLDIDDIPLVIQFYPPEDAETYVHRSGRTGRAGTTGICVTFHDNGESRSMSQIESYGKFRFKTALEGIEIDYSDLDHGESKYGTGARGGKRGRGGRGGRGGSRHGGHSNGGGRGGYNRSQGGNSGRGGSRGGRGGRGGSRGYSRSNY